jgi:hypothetical protein
MHKARNGGKKGSKTGVFVFVHATAFRTKEGDVFGSLQHAYAVKLCKTLFGLRY